MITGVRHIGIIVRNIEHSVAVFKNVFDLKEGEIQIVSSEESQGAGKFAFLQVAGTELALIQPLSDSFQEALGHPPEGLNHIAFTVENIEEAVKVLAEKGVRLGHVTKQGIMDTGRVKIAYLDPRDTDGIFIELVQPTRG